MDAKLLGILLALSLIVIHAQQIPIVSNKGIIEFWRSPDRRDLVSKVLFALSLASCAIVLASMTAATVIACSLAFAHILLAIRK